MKCLSSWRLPQIWGRRTPPLWLVLMLAPATAHSAEIGQKKWEFATGAQIYSSPALGTDGTVYFGSYDGLVYALDLQNGAIKWTANIGGQIYCSPALGAENLYVGNISGSLYAINLSTGTVRWTFKASAGLVSSPAIGLDETVYIGSFDHSVYAVNGGTGALRWKSETLGDVVSSPAIGADGSVYVGSRDWHLYSFDGATGVKKWDSMLGRAINSSPAIGAEGTVYIGSDYNSVFAIDAASGAKKWQFVTGGWVFSTPAVGSDETVYVGSLDQNVYALDGATGAKKWQFTTGNSVVSSPTIGADGTLYFGSTDDKLYALDTQSGIKKWDFAASRRIVGSPVLAGDGTIIFGTEGVLYALQGTAGLAETPWPNFRGNIRNTGFVMSRPSILRQSHSLFVRQTETVVLHLEFRGSPSPQFQWFFNDVAIPGADSADYIVTSAGPEHEGSYTVRLTNLMGQVISQPMTVWVGNVVAESAVGLQLDAPAGTLCGIEYAPFLGTGSTWATLTNIVSPGGPYLVIDPDSQEARQRLYRATAVNQIGIKKYPSLLLTGGPGTRYLVEYVTMVANPVGWTSLTNIVMPGGAFRFIDYDAPSPPRFYRTTKLP